MKSKRALSLEEPNTFPPTAKQPVITKDIIGALQRHAVTEIIEIVIKQKNISATSYMLAAMLALSEQLRLHCYHSLTSATKCKPSSHILMKSVCNEGLIGCMVTSNLYVARGI